MRRLCLTPSMIPTLKNAFASLQYVPCVCTPHPDSQQNRGKEGLSDVGRVICLLQPTGQ